MFEQVQWVYHDSWRMENNSLTDAIRDTVVQSEEDKTSGRAPTWRHGSSLPGSRAPSKGSNDIRDHSRQQLAFSTMGFQQAVHMNHTNCPVFNVFFYKQQQNNTFQKRATYNYDLHPGWGKMQAPSDSEVFVVAVPVSSAVSTPLDIARVYSTPLSTYAHWRKQCTFLIP